MNFAEIAITVLWTFLFGYMIVASIDYGAGFFSCFAAFTKDSETVHGVVKRYLSPMWEVTNVFLIFFVVGFVGFFPDAAYYFGTALILPQSIAIVLLTVRGAYYAFGNYGGQDKRLYRVLYGVSGLLIPASLSIMLVISEGGYINTADGKIKLLAGKLFTSSYAWAVVLLAIFSVLFISAAFLLFYANRGKKAEAVEIFRNYAFTLSLPTILMSLVVFYTIHVHNPDHFARMLDLAWVFGLSLVSFLVFLILVWRKQRYGLAMIAVVFQFGFAFFGYGAAHLPYLIYPYVHLYHNFTNQAMAAWLIGAFALGFVLLVPSLYLLLRLFVFDRKYVVGQR